MINLVPKSTQDTMRGPVAGLRFAVAERPVGRMVRAAFAFALAVACAVPAAAWADVYDTDLIAGKTAAERGLDASACPNVTAPVTLLVSQDGEVLFARDAAAPVKIASITKVMTAIVALENAPLDLTVTVDNEAATVGESSAGLVEGDTMNLGTALSALMVPSGNDASIAIAKAVGAHMTGSSEGAYDAFVAAMNAKAAEIGCTDTVYTNPHGLDFGAFESNCHSTAADVGLQVAYAMKNENFRAIVHGGSTAITVQNAASGAREVYLETTDELIGVYEGICGVKTGTTNEAGYCFAGAVNREAGEFYSVVLNAPDEWQRFEDTMTLFDWAYGNLASQRLIQVDSWYGEGNATVPLVAEVAHTQWVSCTVPATVADPALSVEIFKAKGPVEQSVELYELKGDVEQGSAVGHLTFTQDGAVVAECDLLAAASQKAPGFFEEIGTAIDRFVRDMQGQPTQASSVCYNRVVPLTDR